MVPRVKTAGFRAIEFTARLCAGRSLSAGQLPDPRRVLSHLARGRSSRSARSSPSQAPDLVLIDAMFPAALAQAPGSRMPTAVFCPHLRVSPARHVAADDRDARRHAAAGGLCGLPELDELWRTRDRIVSTSLARIRCCGRCRLGHGAPCRPGAGRRKVRRADRAALVRRRSDSAGAGQLQHRLRAAQCRQAAARARCAGGSAGACGCHHGRHRCAERTGGARECHRAELRGARSRSCGAPRWS